MEIFCNDYRHKVGHEVGDSVLVFPDGTVIQDIHYSTKRGTRSLKKLSLGVEKSEAGA